LTTADLTAAARPLEKQESREHKRREYEEQPVLAEPAGPASCLELRGGEEPPRRPLGSGRKRLDRGPAGEPPPLPLVLRPAAERV